MTDALVIDQTINWIREVVIGCNFCPFAAKALLKKNIRYVVLSEVDAAASLSALLSEMQMLDQQAEIETTFILFATDFVSFTDYLQLVNSAENCLSKNGYDGIYQVAGFHPQYCFAGSDDNDPANYTNRSIFPMLHLLREDSITEALEHFDHPESIPDTNIRFATEKGLIYMQLLRAGCIR